MADLVLSIRLTADGKGLVGEVRGSAEEIRKLGQAATQSNTQAKSSAEQFTSRLKDQAATLGMTRSQTLAYEAAQQDLTVAQRAGVAESIRAIDAYDRKQAMLARVRTAAAAAGAAIAIALVGGLKASVAEAAAAEQAHLKLAAVLTATGHAAGLNKSQLDAMAESLKGATGFDDDQIRNSMAVLLTFKQVQGDTFRQTITMAADLSKLLGQDLQSSVLMLGKALEDPATGLTALRRAGVSFTEQQRYSIQSMVDMGDQGRALTTILQTMRGQGIDAIASSMNTGLTGATNSATLAWTDLLKAIGQTSVVKGAVELTLETWAARLTSMKNIIESGSWLERLQRFAAFSVGLSPAVDTREYSGGREAVLAREGQQAAAGEKAFTAQEEARETTIAQAMGLVPFSGEGWAKLMEQRQQQEQAAVEASEQLRQRDIAGWVAYAQAIIDEDFRIAEALAQTESAESAAAEAKQQRDFDEAERFREQLAQKVADIELGNLTEMELLARQHEEKVAILAVWAGEDPERQAQAKQQLEQLELQHQAKLGNATAQGILQRRQLEQMGMRQQAEFYFGQLAQITAAGAQHNKTLFNLNKVAGIANAIMSTYQGAAKALEWGFPLGPIFAGIIVASGLAQVAAIKSTQFGGGTSAPSIGFGAAVPTTPAPDFSTVAASPAPPAAAAPTTGKITVVVSGTDMQKAITYDQVVSELIPTINEALANGHELELELK
jgi:hypothetical protein